VPLTSKKSVIGNEKTPSVKEKEKSSSKKGKDNPSGKSVEVKEPTPGTHRSPCICVALSSSLSCSESSGSTVSTVTEKEKYTVKPTNLAFSNNDEQVEVDGVEVDAEVGMVELNDGEELNGSYKKCNNQLAT
jgi:hypothetical protein